MARFVVMGVSGCGKTSVGAAVAQRLNARFIDGDDLHAPESIRKMARGEPLTDADRRPWLIEVGRQLAAAQGPVVIGCSALKRSYRDLIREAAGAPAAGDPAGGGGVRFLHLSGSREVLLERMQSRPGHFMPVSLLDSQLATLEPPQPDERVITIDIDQPLDRLVDALITRIGATGAPG